MAPILQGGKGPAKGLEIVVFPVHVLSSIPLTQFVIPAHSIGYYLPPSLPPSLHLYHRPSRSFRPTRSLAALFPSFIIIFIFHFSVSSPFASSQSVIPAHLVFGFFLSFSPPSLLCSFPFCVDQLVIPAHSVFGFFLPFSSPSSLLHPFLNCLDPVGHSGPLGLWLPPLFLILASTLHLPLIASTQSVILAHSVLSSRLSISFILHSFVLPPTLATQSPAILTLGSAPSPLPLPRVAWPPWGPDVICAA